MATSPPVRRGSFDRSPQQDRERENEDDKAVSVRPYFAGFSDALKNICARQAALVSTHLDEEAAAIAHEALDNFNRAASTAAQDLQDEVVNVQRKQVRKHKMANMLKLETARTAADVRVADVKANLEADYFRALEEKVAEFTAGGDALLSEANAVAERLRKELDKSEGRREAANAKLEEQEQKLARLEKDNFDVNYWCALPKAWT